MIIIIFNDIFIIIIVNFFNFIIININVIIIINIIINVIAIYIININFIFLSFFGNEKFIFSFTIGFIISLFFFIFDDNLFYNYLLFVRYSIFHSSVLLLLMFGFRVLILHIRLSFYQLKVNVHLLFFFFSFFFTI